MRGFGDLGYDLDTFSGQIKYGVWSGPKTAETPYLPAAVFAGRYGGDMLEMLSVREAPLCCEVAKTIIRACLH
jgi:hypothetical protein